MNFRFSRCPLPWGLHSRRPDERHSLDRAGYVPRRSTVAGTRVPGWATTSASDACELQRVLTSLNLVVRGRNRACANNEPACATHKHCTSLDGAGSGCVPFFAASWKQRQPVGVLLSSLSWPALVLLSSLSYPALPPLW